MQTIGLAGDEVLTRADLLAGGMSPREITRAVRDGRLIRVRRDRYMSMPAHGIDGAVRVGGRLACVSVLALLGVFVLDSTRLHVHLEHTMSRMRSPDDRQKPLTAQTGTRLALHWWVLCGDDATTGRVGLLDAVAQAIRCQEQRTAVATVDSLLYLGLITWAELHEILGWLPQRYRQILRLADGVAESGPETLLRLILRQQGLRYRAQVRIPSVGRVDFVVEGRLIIECDSKAHHEGWEKQRRDRKRDLAAAALGYSTLRPLAEDIMYDPESVRVAIHGVLHRHPRHS